MTPAHRAQPAHRRPPAISRRGLLGLAGLAALPAGALGVREVRDHATVAEAGTTPAAPPAASASPTPAHVTSGGGPVKFKPGTVMLGAYLDLEGLSAGAAQALRRRQLGRSERIMHVFYDWTDTLPGHLDGLPEHACPMISWRGTRLADILDGSHDALIARAARRLGGLGRPALLRWGWEMNGSWYDWGGARNGGTASGYVRAWRRLHDIFADEGTTNVSWVWSPNWNDSPDEDWNRMARYYPGDRYVDWVGVSGYNLHRETPEALFGAFYRAYADTRPVMISEVGAVDRGGSTKAEWITMFADWVKDHPAVGAVTWFDTDTHYAYSEKWRIDTTAESLAAYRAMATDPTFTG